MSLVSAFPANPFGKDGRNSEKHALIIFAALVLIFSMDLAQLVFVLVGAVMYAAMQSVTFPKSQAPRRGKLQPGLGAALPAKPFRDQGHSQDGDRTGGKAAQAYYQTAPAPSRHSGQAEAYHHHTTPAPSRPSGQPTRAETPTPAPHVPPVAPTFKAVGWDGEVDELLREISGTAKSDVTVAHLVRAIEDVVLPLIPEARVLGFVNGDLSSDAAFRVAVPEVDIVLCASPAVMAARLQSQSPAARAGKVVDRAERLGDIRRFQKSVLRNITDRLVGSARFKFRRSALRGDEPKVTLLAAPRPGANDEAIPIDFSVNSTSPGFNAALLAECGHLEPRARALVVLVRRWAKSRGVCHASKGNLGPYAWTLLAVYFLQVAVEDEGPLLPPMADFELASGLARRPDRKAGPPPSSGGAGGTSKPKPKWTPPATRETAVGALFKEFVRFYSEVFDFENEAVSVWTGERGPPGPELPMHQALNEEGQPAGRAPSIEDPFSRSRNLGEGVTELGLARMKQELARARGICASAQPSLTALLEPWAPADRVP